MNHNKLKLYWKTCLIRRGYRINLHLTYRCNLDCPYCSTKMPIGKWPPIKESTLEMWKDRVTRMSKIIKVREVYVAGGEPTIMPYFVELINWLIDQGFHVLVLTNLKLPDKLLQIKRSYRFSIRATYHHADDKERFLEAYNKIYPIHRIDVDEIVFKRDGNKLIRVHETAFPFSHEKPYQGIEEFFENFVFFPNCELTLGFMDYFKLHELQQG